MTCLFQSSLLLVLCVIIIYRVLLMSACGVLEYYFYSFCKFVLSMVCFIHAQKYVTFWQLKFMSIGAGKTSFLYTLCGKAKSYGNISGEIYINNELKEIYDFADVVGFVPQNDIMTAYRRVKEVLRINADFRLSRSVSSEVKDQIVEDVMKLLGLYDIRNTIIGDEKRRGISGGQKKRVNIGMELVSQPSMLFLGMLVSFVHKMTYSTCLFLFFYDFHDKMTNFIDEPTSGLDATCSNEVIQVLKAIAQRGTTVAVVLHQPRYEIFEQFDNVILLAKGGKTVYMGPTKQAVKYFENIGYNMPQNMNPADYLMDVISGDVQATQNEKNHASIQEAVLAEDLPNAWFELQGDTELAEKYSMAKNSHFQTVGSNFDYEKRTRATFIQQIWMVICRAVITKFRQRMTLSTDIIMITIAGLVVGFAGDSAKFSAVPNNLFMVGLTSSFCSAAVSLRLFGEDKLVFWRYSSVGINDLAYYLGMNISTLPWIFVYPALFLLLFWPMAMPRATVFSYYVIIVLGMYNAQSIGHLVSIAVDSGKSSLVSIVTVLTLCLLNGFNPTIITMESSPITKALSIISYARWQQQALWDIEMQA